MTDEAWNREYVRCLGVRLSGDAIDEVDEAGNRIVGDTLLLLFNAHHEAIPFTLPAQRQGEFWERLLDTAEPAGRRAWRTQRQPLPARGPLGRRPAPRNARSARTQLNQPVSSGSGRGRSTSRR